ncbi:hypothetical protein HTZ84_21655 [Haloterrigena sp. SYSU A558-1]|uniref:Uncharacterized protein n=1 Tax=Haloterrigena gelatinilytica TaxID=2741724 RepID=A0ABX2LJ16_9EURY|nr:hypothetical protein [Haloterrigena gelatinilytica]NUC74873.1 hypothetical protein [Haloterrigena gelatinilytica]
MTNSLKSKLFGTETWNNKWYVYVGTPIFAFLGALCYWLFGIHLVSSTPAETVLMILFPGTAVVLGSTILAVIDGL